MSSSLIHSLDSLSHFLDLQAENSDYYAVLEAERLCLTNLKIFVVCATKFGNHSLLRSLFLRIEDVVASYPRQELREGMGYWQFRQISQYLRDEIKCFKTEIDEWYITMFDPTNSQQSTPLTPDDALQITHSILHNILDFHLIYDDHDLSDLVIPMESFGVQLTFLNNFLQFAIKTCVEHSHLHDLFTHFDAAAINIAHIFFRAPLTYTDLGECRQEMQLKLSALVEKTRPTDPHVYQSYAEALNNSNLSTLLQASTQDMDDDSKTVFNNFLDSLILLLWDFLCQDTCQLTFMKDQLQQLYEGLKFLATIPRQQQLLPNFDEELRDQIPVLVRDAGILIFYSHQTNIRNNPGLQDLLERINAIQSRFEERVPRTSIFNTYGISSELAIVDSLLENLMELTNHIDESVSESLVPTIREELVFLRSFLEQTLEFRNEPDHDLQALQHLALDVTFKVEFLIDKLAVGDISDSLSVISDFLVKEIGKIKTAAGLKISHDVKAKEVIQTSSHQTPPVSNPSKTDEFVGFHDETASIVDRLKRGSTQLRVVAICGMGGAGKTTLASEVFNHQSILHHFNVRAWCVVSQEMDKKKVLIQLLNQMDSRSYSTMSESDLEEKLWRCLKGKKYLIFLDDVWNLEDWKSMERVFPNDSCGSRILVTSRPATVVPKPMLDQEPHHIRQLTKEESLKLMQRKLFPTTSAWPPQLHELGMEIAENCNGLPLMVVIVAGLLAKTNQEDWKELSSNIGSGQEPLMNTFELSFKHLPNHLKPCFLYFGAFPEDEKVSVKRLIRLWIAEGFVRKAKQKSIEDVAKEYMADLIERSLVMLAQTRSTGGAKTCRIHDLVHDFCSRKVKEQDFFHFFRGDDQLSNFDEPIYLRRLCIYDEEDHFKKSKLFWPRARTLLFINSNGVGWHSGDYLLATLFIIPIFKFLKVLDLEQTDLGWILPGGIGLLIHLKYLSVRGSIRKIPSSIGNLSNLEIFILNSETRVQFPATFWSLQKLRCVSIKSSGGICSLGYEISSVLCDLESFSGAIICPPARMEKQMEKIPNVRRLKCYLFRDEMLIEKFDKIIIPDFLRRLESLHLWQYYSDKSTTFDFYLPGNLKKLTLSHFKMPWMKISTIGKLPNLEVLKLNEAFSGDTWEMEEGDFSKLRLLKLSELDIDSWIAGFDDQFPCLEKLILDKCYSLKEMPDCLKYVPTLEMIDVFSCSSSVESFVKSIEEEQKELGNLSIKIQIRRW